jgi:hypothetical protein
MKDISGHHTYFAFWRLIWKLKGTDHLLPTFVRSYVPVGLGLMPALPPSLYVRLENQENISV